MIEFIHVGKCAGTSIREALGQLSIKHKAYHCFDANIILSEKMKQSRDSYYLLSVRDPIERFISAFYYDLYSKRIKSNRDGPKGRWKKLYSIFEIPNQVAESLSSKDLVLKNMAEIFIRSSRLHAHLSLSWYISLENVKYLNEENCYVIRTEKADQDFLNFLRKMNLSLQNYSRLPREKSDYKKSIDNYNVTLSELSKINLENAYFDDYLILDGLYRRGLIDEPY
jgi:hypothetical protein